MKFDGLSHYSTGVLVPVAALRSDENPGVGEFADLLPLAHWCVSAGLDLIQILPVNDSGGESSPYSALSAFALHPLYLRITDLPEIDLLAPDDRAVVTEAVAEIRARHDANTRIRYHDILAEKLTVIRTVYDLVLRDQVLAELLNRFMEENTWVRAYAVFKVCKTRFNERSWKEWPELRNPAAADIAAMWSDESVRDDLLFHVWLQLRLEEQFLAAAAGIAECGVTLKGDLPILMSEDSVDVWARRDLFITHLRAGSPPDAGSHLGQNWGLPIYDWDRMAADGYQWWQDRLRAAGKFYSAYRIDHVLGFFRVWAIAGEHYTGVLGRFRPSVAATRDDLRAAGLDDGRVRWLAEPHITGAQVHEAFGPDAGKVIDAALSRIGGEDLYLFRDDLGGERGIQALPLPDSAREWLVGQFADRALLAMEDDTYAPTWSFRNCSRYETLNDGEKGAFETLVRDLSERSERVWEEQARRLLGFMRETTEMLPCAEDLGVIPRAVPRVLGDLGILSLRIPRWSRLWDQPGRPYVHPTDYPFLSVCAPSVHDTSTLRGWWVEEPDVQAFWAQLGLPGTAPGTYTPAAARTVTGKLLETASAICVLQVQDILALTSASGDQAPDARTASEERVNVPGTVNDYNWGFRMPITLSGLSADSELTVVLRTMAQARRARPIREDSRTGGTS